MCLISDDEISDFRALNPVEARAIDLVYPFIKQHEGFRKFAYYDSHGRVWTIGYGSTMIPDENTSELRQVTKNDVISKEDASKLVLNNLYANSVYLHDNIPWISSLRAESLAALYDVAYNAGPSILEPSSSPTLNRLMRTPGIARDAVVWRELLTYRKAGGVVVNGLVNRRRDALKAFGPKIISKDSTIV